MEKHNDCIFCKIAAGEIPAYTVYEDDSVKCFLDAFPITRGHVLVIPKSHYRTLDDCPADVLSDVSSVLGKIARAVKNAVGSSAYNVLCNNGKAAGQKVFHVHFHVIPRTEGDGLLRGWPAKELKKEDAEQVLKKITENMESY